MTQYALNHFKTEEGYMRKLTYPDYYLHHDEHNDFIKKTVDFCNRTTNGDYDIRGDLLKYLQQWVVNHIQEMDKKFGIFLNLNEYSILKEDIDNVFIF